MKVALVLYARHENRYLKEWIDYYANIGIDHIYIGDNNDVENDEDIESFVQELGYSDFITVFDKKNRSDETNFDIRRQAHFYNEIYHLCGKDYDWMAFFDVDEYFNVFDSFYPSKNIKDYIDKCLYGATKSGIDIDTVTDIRLSWLIYTDNGHIFYEDKPVLERFTEISEQMFETSFNWLNYIGKSIVKTKKEFLEMDIHFPRSTDENTNTVSLYNGGFDSVENRYFPTCDFIKNDAVLKHFYCKSLEEQLHRRIFDRKTHNIGDGNSTFDIIVENYFKINKRTIEKEKVVELYRKLYDNGLI